MARLLFLFSLLFLLLSCRPMPSSPAVITLSRLEPLPQEPATAVKPLRVAVAAILSPRGALDRYTLLLDYLGEQLQRPVELVQRRTYQEVNELVRDGAVDLAFVCTSAYVVGARDFGMQLLAAPEVRQATVYHSLLLVPADSQATSMADLRGRVFAFTDPMSTTGRNYPFFLVQQLGETPDSFFQRTFFTYSHDDAIQAVANRVADGAAVDSLVYTAAIAREPELAERTRVIFTSPAFGIPPVVAGPQLRPQVVAELQAVLFNMADDPAGQAALQAVGIDRFVPVDDSLYDSVRDLERATNHEP